MKILSFRSWLIAALIANSVAGFTQEGSVSNSYEIGKLKDGHKVNVWEYYDEDGNPELKINHSTGRVLYLKSDTSKYVIKKQGTWIEQQLDIYPKYIGSDQQLLKNIITNDNLIYPTRAIKKSTEGYVYVTFEIDSIGNPVNFTVEKTIDNECRCSEMVIKVLKQSIGHWIPAQIDGKTYNSRFLISFKFQSNQNKNGISASTDLPSAKRLTEVVIVNHGKGQGNMIQNSENHDMPLTEDLIRGIFEHHEIESALKSKSTAKFLFLESKNLTALPDEITTLSNLKLLDLRNNQIESLPNDIHRLYELEELYAENNQINVLPTSFHKLRLLSELSLSSNDFKEFPPQITKLKSLRALDLSNNEISSVPAEIIQLKNLELLVLENNKLKELPAELFKLKSLRELYLKGNELSETYKNKLKSEFPNIQIITD